MADRVLFEIAEAALLDPAGAYDIREAITDAAKFMEEEKEEELGGMDDW